MSKRDTIIAALLVNVAVLAILFLFARNTSDDQPRSQNEISYTLEDTPVMVPSPVMEEEPINAFTPQEEVKETFSSYEKAPMEVPIIHEEPKFVMTEEPKPHVVSGQVIEVVVKKGDALEKIARANGTTVEEIKRLNNLTSEKLSIGQVLKVTPNKSTSKATSTTTPIASNTSGPVYYTIKSGDNPWKIARQYKVRYEDILKINNLNEEKARNLKVGDRIRIK